MENTPLFSGGLEKEAIIRDSEMYEQTQVYRLDGLSDDGIHTLMAGVVGSQRDHALADRLLHQVRACMKAGIQAVLVCVDGWLAYVHSIERAFREKIAHTKQGKPVVSRAIAGCGWKA